LGRRPIQRNAIARKFPNQRFEDVGGIRKCAIDASILAILIKGVRIRQAVPYAHVGVRGRHALRRRLEVADCGQVVQAHEAELAPLHPARSRTQIPRLEGGRKLLGRPTIYRFRALQQFLSAIVRRRAGPDRRRRLGAQSLDLRIIRLQRPNAVEQPLIAKRQLLELSRYLLERNLPLAQRLQKAGNRRFRDAKLPAEFVNLSSTLGNTLLVGS
jgi:hypothetical protein